MQETASNTQIHTRYDSVMHSLQLISYRSTKSPQIPKLLVIQKKSCFTIILRVNSKVCNALIQRFGWGFSCFQLDSQKTGWHWLSANPLPCLQQCGGDSGPDWRACTPVETTTMQRNFSLGLNAPQFSLCSSRRKKSFLTGRRMHRAQDPPSDKRASTRQ